MAQLPRCVQQASWKRVSGVCSLTIRSLSCGSSFGKRCSTAAATSASPGFTLALWPSQSLLVLGGSSQKLSRSVYTDLSRDRLRFAVRRAPLSITDSLVSKNTSLGSSGSPALGTFLARSVSSADSSTVVDGEVKDSFSKDERETQRSSLLSEIEAKERELEELRNALRQAENDSFTASGCESDPVLESSCAEAEQIDSVNPSINETSFLVVEGDSTSDDTSDEEDIGVIDENAGVIYVESGRETQSSPSSPDGAIEASTSGDSVEEASSEEAVEGSHILASSSDASAEIEKTPSEHSWPQWTRFLKFLAKGGYFANEEGKEIDIKSVNPDDYGLVKRACLNFARERDDIFTSFAQKDLEIIARFGCPTIDRKVVNAGKRLREYLKIDEVSICKPCALRPSCERADFRVASGHGAGTPEVIKLLSQYAINVSPDSGRDLKISELVQKSCTNLLQQALTLGSKPRDPKLPKFERKEEMVKSNREDRVERRPRSRLSRGSDADVEMKPGDWKCLQCEYVNFARNRNCRECEAKRPAPEMRPGDWTCPECDFLNFSRNRECHECKAEKPPGVGFDAFRKGDRGDREGRFDRGSDRGERVYGRDRESRDFDRRSSRYDSQGDRERGSFDRSDRSRERNERGMDRRFRGGDERDLYDRTSSRGDGDRDSFDRRSRGTEERTGRRNKFEEWKPDLTKKNEFVDEYDDDDDFPKKPLKGRNLDDDLDDLDLDLDDDEDVEPLDDEEFEDMRPAALSNRSSRRSNDQRSVGRIGEDERPRWEDDRFSGNSRRGGSRGGRGGNRDYDRGDGDSRSPSYSRGGGRGGRGAARGGRGGRGASGGRGRR